MKAIILKELSYRFRGQDRTFSFSEGLSYITGRNGCGKTTAANAFLWLLTGYDIYDRMNYNLFDVKTGDKECHVTATLLIDGIECALTRKSVQVWQKNRKTGEMCHNGDKNEFYVDGVQVSSTDFGKYINDNIDTLDHIKLMSNPNMYKLMDRNTLRAYVTALTGDIRGVEMNGDYSCIHDLLCLNGSNIGECKNIIEKKLTDVKNRIKKNRTSVELLQSRIATDIDFDAIESELASQKEERKKVDEAFKSQFANIEGKVALRKKQEDAILSKKKEMEQATIDYRLNQEKGLQELEDRLREARTNNKYVLNRKKEIAGLIKEWEETLVKKEGEIVRCREDYKTIQLRMFDNKCPECGQEYTGDKLELKKKVFSARKTQDLADVATIGKELKESIASIKGKIQALQEESEGLKCHNTEKMEEAIYEYKKTMIPLDTTAYEKEIAEMEAAKVEIPVSSAMINLQTRMGEIMVAIEHLTNKLAKKQEYESIKSDISSYEDAYNGLLSEESEWNTKKYALEKYIVELADLSNAKINTWFTNVSVETLRANKSGGLLSVCDMSYDGVSNTCNTASEIIIGCEICNAFQKFFEISMPLFIDRVESINEASIPSHEGQTILLKYQENDLTISNIN